MNVLSGRASLLVRSIVIAAILLVGIALILRVLFVFATSDASALLYNEVLIPFIAVAYTIVGALVVSRHPRNPVGWIFLSVGVLSVLQTLANAHYAYSPVLLETSQPPGLNLAKWLASWVWMPAALLPITFVFLLFPDGRLLSPRWRLILWSATLGLAFVVLAMAFHPGPVESWGLEANPFGFPAAAGILEMLMLAAMPLLLIGFLGSVAAFIARVRRAQGIERQQMKWLIYAVGLLLAGILLVALAFQFWPESKLVNELGVGVVSLTMLGIAVAASIAILRYRLYDINLVINRTVVYGALTIIIVAIYTLIVGGLGILFQSQGNLFIALLATGLVAVLFQPLRARVQRGVNRLFYGERDDPLAALAHLGKRLEATMAPEIVLPTLVETIAQTLRLPYVAISLRTGDEFEISAQTGEEVESVIHLPLVYQGVTVGELIAGQRSISELFSQTDTRLLENIAYQAGPAVHAVQLTAALQRSRQQLVTAQEEERRRLRRDLHDGVGPVLASQGLKMAAVGQLLHDNPAKAQRLLDELVTQNQASVAEIRRLVYELRPAALDELGLVGAVKDYASGLSSGARDSSRFQVDVQAPATGLPSLPAAIEVAAYRITTEALTNVARHAQARRAVVSIETIFNNGTGMLHVEIADDGLGLSPNHKSGVGLISMRERAEEIGGRFSIESADKQGTRVTADLPLAEMD